MYGMQILSKSLHYARWIPDRSLDNMFRYVYKLAQRLLKGEPQAVLDLVYAPFTDNNLIMTRNLFVAPIAEEFVFRGCMVPLLRIQVRKKLPSIYTMIYSQ